MQHERNATEVDSDSGDTGFEDIKYLYSSFELKR